RGPAGGRRGGRSACPRRDAHVPCCRSERRELADRPTRRPRRHRRTQHICCPGQSQSDGGRLRALHAGGSAQLCSLEHIQAVAPPPPPSRGDPACDDSSSPPLTASRRASPPWPGGDPPPSSSPAAPTCSPSSRTASSSPLAW